MKALAFALMTFVATQSFASSVCLFYTPTGVGDSAVVDCDGKEIKPLEFTVELDMDIIGAQAKTLSALVNQGYKIVSQDGTGSSEYTLVNESRAPLK